MDMLPGDWRSALRAAVAARRVMVIGAADTGKSHFARYMMAEDGGPDLVDLDPGQKMIGAPGTLGLGRLRGDGSLALERFVFIGSTSPVHLRDFLPATRTLLRGRRRRLVVNTSGFVQALGVRLQQMTIEAVRPDLIVAIADGAELDPILIAAGDIRIERIRPSPHARRKGMRELRRARRQAFAAALDGAVRRSLPPDIPFRPAPPASFDGPSRPVCALSAADGRHICIGILEEVGAGEMILFAPVNRRPIASILLGRMWAEPADQAWRLSESAWPSWG
jgi:polynucleotide 5'-kinase involved in rRNA processing